MTFEKREISKGRVAILTELSGRIEDTGDFLDVIASSRSDILVIDADHLTSAFFDLKSGVLGELLQKISNYRKRLVIRGDWSKVSGAAMKDFIRESNRGGQIVFSDDTETGLAALR